MAIDDLAHYMKAVSDLKAENARLAAEVRRLREGLDNIVVAVNTYLLAEWPHSDWAVPSPQALLAQRRREARRLLKGESDEGTTTGPGSGSRGAGDAGMSVGGPQHHAD